MFADKFPLLKWPQMILWVVFLAIYPIYSSALWLPFIANVLGLLRKAGLPKISPDYVADAMIADELH